MANNRYQYKPLTEHDSIRLLALLPSADSTADIRCDLLTTTLSREHRDVFTNLDSALRDIRDPLRKQYLWIDAICINQANSPEKNKQVIQMAKVYQIARKTNIYLGEPTEASTLLLEAISRAYKRGPGHVNATETDILALLFNSITTFTREHYKKALDLFLGLLQRPWFTRVWVFQELLFSADPRVQCGRHSVSWEQLFQATKMIEDLGFLSFQRLEYYCVFVAINEERRNFKLARRRPSTLAENLINILTIRRGLGVSDPRDMVFADKGIVQASLYQDDLDAEDIAIDYSKRVEEVLINLARYCIKTFPKDRRLEILSCKEVYYDFWWVSAPLPTFAGNGKYPCDTNVMKSNSGDSTPRRPQSLIDMFTAQLQSLRIEKIAEIARTLSPHNMFLEMNEEFFYNKWEAARLFASTISIIMWAHAVKYEDRIAQIAISEVLYNRKFATLEDGTLLLVPVTAMEGEVVCWLGSDLTTPFVLRRNAEQPTSSENTIKDPYIPLLRDSKLAYPGYTFVGECHIDTPVYDHDQQSTHSAVKNPCSIQDNYFGEVPGFNNRHRVEIFVIN
ncbi:hypothetical protein BHYA_0015g00570 [Botrytis hyacinthi]|uniref:Heterokaryon incompatibility domain-containing protein n=1 Tax=Botrytis hyacinthi TaxID=278943 RepID=A0A4Z1GY34_9HELO|nr:hypothetical protein BHYA_0015g00570 [Botrytis hyacinthi]